MEQNQQPNPSPAPEPPTSPQQPSSKPKPKWLVPVIVVIGVIALGFIAWGAYKLLKPTPVEDEFENWNIYRNEEYGFEIKFPNNWAYHVNDYETQQLICFYPGKYPGDCPGILSVSWNIDFQERYTKTKQLFEKDYDVIESIISIDDTEGKLLTIKDTTGFSKSVFFEKENYIYNFAIIVEEEFLFNQILSTFKFIEPSETANWKTYQNEKYRFEVRYPGDWQFEESANPEIGAYSFTFKTRDGSMRFDITRNPGGIGYEYLAYVSSEQKTVEFLSEESVESFYNAAPHWYIECQDRTNEGKARSFNINRNLEGTIWSFWGLYCGNKNENKDQTFLEILSTFKFIESDETANVLNIHDIKMTIPDKWSIDKRIENVENITGYTRVYIKTDYQPYNVFLVVDVKKNNEYDIEWYKGERRGGDYTKIKDGEIFKYFCAPGLACNGAIVNGDVYTFGWDIESDQSIPENLDGIWMPDHNVTQEDIWNILLSIEAE
jgi:hypothetical protein